MPTTPELCEFDGCDQVAAGEVHAQWTVVDFVDYRMCEDHMDEATTILSMRLVDGQVPADVWCTFWQLEEEDGVLYIQSESWG